MVLGPVAVLKAGASLAAIGIACGAVGAHALAPRLGAKASTWTMAANYALVNGAALIALSKWNKPVPSTLILSGATMFSGSIFVLLLYRERLGKLSKIIGPITPLGGTLMIAGYVALLF